MVLSGIIRGLSNDTMVVERVGQRRVSRWPMGDDGVDVREQEVYHDLEGRCNRRHGYLVVGGLFVAG